MRLLLLALLGVGVFLATRGTARGALSGTVRLGSTKPATGLQVPYGALLPPGWDSTLPRPFEFLVGKIVDGDRAKTHDTAIIAEAAKQSGVPFHGFGYHYLRSAAEAQAEAIVAAREALAWGAKAYWVDAEHEWTGTWGAPPNPGFVEHMATFVATFRGHAPGVKLVGQFLGPWRWGTSAERAPEVAAMFDYFAPMLYATKRKTIASRWAEGYAVARAAGVPFAATLGSGRKDDKGADYWGYAFAKGSEPGAVDLARMFPPEWVAFYVGPGGGTDMILGGNMVNPDLVTLSGLLKEPPSVA